ncbi:hypothetical protein amad1_12295 [Alteromonas mediterranea DE1]|uniref:Uncharacterized protein n=1 Tax=Alteromonas mediterranea TaxID=314275 RepID=A0AAC9ADM3_9ALTE|nr:hypothetical protein amad1_12295 [Alteromonas mediterranea DE1]AGP97973.1 hypothetical protein I635_12275 [Alteromonas mediterranea UM7]AGQ02224.1 hypothetical protein I636_11870 [Alteromonas mediterranea UM4b]AMJ78984.1 hypothetical protein AV942_12115 [Alteromonas mediterranea]AMJ83130.1 hypothetical protein AV941_12140 [Alteromonas mediterranea]
MLISFNGAPCTLYFRSKQGAFPIFKLLKVMIYFSFLWQFRYWLLAQASNRCKEGEKFTKQTQ